MAHALNADEWLVRLRPGETPVFRHTKQAILALNRRSDQLSSRELATPVLADPLATLRLIYAANNRQSRHVGNEIATVEHAVMMQGVGPYLNQAVSLPEVEGTHVARNKIALNALYRLLRLAQHAAWQARDFAVLHADIRAEEVQVAALLYYAPEFLFWLQAPEVAHKLARLRRRMPSQEAEVEALGFELAPLRLAMLEGWKIPDMIRDLLDERFAERSRQIILKASLGIANRSRHGWWDEALAEDYLALAGIENTPLETVIATAHDNAVRVARAGHWVPVPPAAAWLPMLPGPWPDEADYEEEEETVAARQTAKPRAETPPRPTAPRTAVEKPVTAPRPLPPTKPAACVSPDHKVFQDALQGIKAHLDESLTLNQMSALILKGLHTGLGLNRILFAMVTPDGKRVKCRFTLGIPADDPLRHFEFHLGGKDLFSQLMTKTQGMWLNAESRPRLWPLVGPRLQAMIGEGEFYAMALHANNQPLAMIYADRGHGECGLDPHTYTDFKMLCLQAARGLGKIKT